MKKGEIRGGCRIKEGNKMALHPITYGMKGVTVLAIRGAQAARAD